MKTFIGFSKKEQKEMKRKEIFNISTTKKYFIVEWFTKQLLPCMILSTLKKFKLNL